MRQRGLKKLGLVALVLTLFTIIPAGTASANIWGDCFECGAVVGLAVCERVYNCCGGWNHCVAYTRCIGTWPFRECLEVCTLSGGPCYWV